MCVGPSAYGWSVTTSLARIIISVSSLEDSLPLYRDALGLTVTYTAGQVARLSTDGPPVEVMLHERPPTPGDFGIAVSFRVEDVDGVTEAAVAAGATIVDPPADQPWGERQAVLHDRDGQVICLVMPGHDPDVRPR